ncbi:MAG: site-specific integrase [bacterium]
MSIYFVKKKGWRYDFTLKGKRYTDAWFKTKKEVKEAEAKRKEELANPVTAAVAPTIGITFFELVNRRLDYVKAYHSATYYKDYRYMARRWLEKWRDLSCDEISIDMAQFFILKRAKVSAYAANYDLRCLRALFNFGIKRGWILSDPTKSITFLPIEKKMKYIPSKEDILKVILAADPDTQDYLWTIIETLARVSEINRLTWNEINFEDRYVVLYTRKKKGGHLTPRKVPMTNRLYKVLSRRYSKRDKTKPWVFWHTYWSSKTGEKKSGPYYDRKKVMRGLCKKTGVKYFRFHAFRHFGASVLDHCKAGTGSIQRILGHENRSTTEIYLHSIGESEREAMEIFEHVWDGCENENSHTDSHTEKK